MQEALRTPWRSLRALAPYEAVRLKHRLFAPRNFAKLQSLRTAPAEDSDSVSLAPFLEKRAIFVHIPKCAGLALSKAVFGCRGGAHIPVEIYQLVFSRSEYRSFFKFTIVRNPWDRVVSAYHFLKDGGLGESDARMAARSVARYGSFGEFVEGYFGRPDFADVLHFRPQHRFVCLTGSSAPAVDHVGHFETLADDFAYICGRLGVESPLARVNEGRSRPKDYRALYTDRTAAIVADAYARDIDLFGYTF